MNLGFRGGEAFPTLGHLGLFTNSITSPALYFGIPVVPMMFWAFLMKMYATFAPINEVNALIDFTCSRHTNSQIVIIYGAALCLP